MRFNFYICKVGLIALLLNGGSLSQNFLFMGIAHAQAESAKEAPIVASVSSVLGKAYLLRGDKIPCVKGMKLYAADQLVTSAKAAVKIVFADGSNFVALENSSVSIEDYYTLLKGNKLTVNSVLQLIRGKARFFFKPRDGGQHAVVKTSNGVFGVRGTEFFIDQTVPEKTELVVLKGVVAATNVDKPLEEVMVNANERTSVGEKTAPEKVTAAPAQLVAELKKSVESLPEKTEDGIAPEDIDLPAPIAQAPTLNRRISVAAKSAPIQNSSVSSTNAAPLLVQNPNVPEALVLPLNAVLMTKSGLSCDFNSIARMRRASQLIDVEAVTLGRELADCPALRDESLFWLYFYHKAVAENGAANEVSKWGRQEQIPLDSKSERERLLLGAMEGKFSDLKKKIESKDAIYINDSEAILALARSLVRAGKYSEAQNIYALIAQTKRLQLEMRAEIEAAYVLLLDSKFDVAEAKFEQIKNTNLSFEWNRAAERGIELARAHTLKSKGTELRSLAFEISHYRDADSFLHSKGSVTADHSWFNIGAENHRLSLKNNGAELEKRGAVSLWVAKKIDLSSGTIIALKGGLFEAQKHNGFFNLDGQYKFDFDLGIFAGIKMEPLALNSEVNNATALELNEMTVSGGVFWRDWLKYRLSISGVGEKESKFDQLLDAKLQLHRGVHAGDFVVIVGSIHHERHKEAVAEIYSPESEVDLTGGVNLGKQIFDPTHLNIDFIYGFVNRKARSEGEVNLKIKSEKRETVAKETQMRLRVGTEFQCSKSLMAKLGAQYQRADNEFAQKTFDSLSALASLNWKMSPLL